MKLFMTWVLVIAILLGGYFFIYPQFNSEQNENLSSTKISAESKKILAEQAVLNVGDIKPDMKDKAVTVVGKVINLSQGKGMIFCTLNDVYANQRIKVVVFPKTVKKPEAHAEILQNELTKDKEVFIYGKEAIYKDELEIIAFKVYTK